MSRWRVLAADAADMNAFQEPQGGMNATDNAQNSFEQEGALTTWVDMAVDQLTRGATQQEVVAKLAHDGCPDPEGIYARAIEQQAGVANAVEPQPEQQMIPPQMEQVDFNTPPPGVTANIDPALDPMGQFQHTYPQQPDDGLGVQGVDMLKQKLMEAEARGDEITAQALRAQIQTMFQGYTGHVRVANFTGKFLGMELDQWGRLVVAVETPNGPTQLDGSKVEVVDTPTDDAVTDIQTFIDNIPEVEPNDLGSVHARIAGLQEARSRVITALGKADDSQLGHLIKMRTACKEAISALTDEGNRIVTPTEKSYLESQPSYKVAKEIAANGSVGGFDSPDMDPVIDQMVAEASTYNVSKENTEGAEIFVSELPDLMVHDAAAVRDFAEAITLDKTAGMSGETQYEIVQEFCDAVEKHRLARAGELAPMMERTASTKDVIYTDLVNPNFDGPAEALFG